MGSCARCTCMSSLQASNAPIRLFYIIGIQNALSAAVPASIPTMLPCAAEFITRRGDRHKWLGPRGGDVPSVSRSDSPLHMYDKWRPDFDTKALIFTDPGGVGSTGAFMMSVLTAAVRTCRTSTSIHAAGCLPPAGPAADCPPLPRTHTNTTRRTFLSGRPPPPAGGVLGVHKGWPVAQDGWVAGFSPTSCGVWLHVVSQLHRRKVGAGLHFKRPVKDLQDDLTGLEPIPPHFWWPLQAQPALR